MNKHTPGPWEVFGDWGIKDQKGRIIASFEPLKSDDQNGNSNESFANASLIASAPNLLEALEKMIDWYDKHQLRNEPAFPFYSISRTAIAKARGES